MGIEVECVVRHLPILEPGGTLLLVPTYAATMAMPSAPSGSDGA